MYELLNRLWLRGCRNDARKFQLAVRDPRTAQAETLNRQLRVLAPSQWGSRWRLGLTTSVDDYQRRVPLTSYEDYRPAIAQIQHTGNNPLTTERVNLLEPTSGRSEETKLIPYTSSLRQEFQSALAVWVHNLFTERTAVMRGSAYWSISPPLQRSSVSRSGIPMGFDDDSAYLGFFSRQVARRLLAVPGEVKKYTNADDWRYATAWYLLQSPKLAFISVWSPTFLLQLMTFCDGASRARIARDVYDGICRLSDGRHIRDRRKRARFSQRHRKRVVELLDGPLDFSHLSPSIWPSLSVISCWADASSQRYVSQVRQLFPHAEISPKGLLSTEAFISIPIMDKSGCALSLRSHFLEFVPEDGRDPVLAHQLDKGQRYQVVTTTGGGLYRYQTGDWIEVTGFLDACPLVRFMGRDSTSDLVGEKLTDQFTQYVIEKLLAETRQVGRFALLVPNENKKNYCLFLELDRYSSQERAENAHSLLTKRLDEVLCENVYYRQARQLGQLDAATIVQGETRGYFLQRYLQLYHRHGIRAGDVKLVALETNPERARDFLAND